MKLRLAAGTQRSGQYNISVVLVAVFGVIFLGELLALPNWLGERMPRAMGENGAPERIRTSDPQIRSLVLYPAELRARCGGSAPKRTPPCAG